MKKAIFLAVILYQSSLIIVNAQNLDSLYSIWQDPTQPDSTRGTAYSEYITKGYIYSNPDTAIVLAQALLRFGEQHKLPKTKASAYNIMGLSSWVRSDFPQALEYYQRSLKISKELGDKKGMSSAIGNMGIIYSLQGDYPKALEYFQRSLKIKEELGDKKSMVAILGNIGNIYHAQDDFPQALEYYQRSLKIYEEIGDKQVMASTINNIGIIYKDQGDYPKALEYYQRSLKIAEEIGNKPVMANAINNIGLIYQEQGNYPKALEYYQRSLKIYEEIGDKRGSTYALSGIGFTYKEQGDYPKALEYCKKSLGISEEIGALRRQQEACQCLYDTYKAMGNGNEALFYHEQLSVLKDSLFNEENTKKLTRLELNYEFDKKETAARLEQEKKEAIANAELKRNKLIRNGFIGAFAVMLIFAIIFFSQRNKIKKGKKQSDDLLLNILPAEVAEELKANGKTEAKHFDEATILFTDFKGFTEHSAKLSAQDLVLELNTCFKAFDGIMDKYKIEKIKTIGDAYMAASGINTDGINELKSAKLMVLAALEMQDFISKRKAENDAANKPAFEMRLGIHTGPVVAGIVGVKKFQYDIWGDTVNTASRMESNGEAGKVNISQATFELLKDDSQFSFESRGKIEAKGKGEMEMYFVNMKTKMNEI